MERINSWVSDKTQGKITQIVDSIPPDSLMFLINTIYFKGSWQKQFVLEKTVTQPFYLNTGEAKNHPLMSNFARYAYHEDETFQAVGLPYGDGRLSMYVYLPSEDRSLDDFLQRLTAEGFNSWMEQFRGREGFIELPRFTQEYDISLNGVLRQLGMISAFDAATANFSSISDQSIAMNEAKHKAVIEVNEEGTEAAAVTSIRYDIISYNEPFLMNVNRPFFFVIRDNETKSILFMGSVFEPTLSSELTWWRLQIHGYFHQVL